MKIRKTKSGPGMDGIIIPAGALLLAGFGWLLHGSKGFSFMLFLVFGGYSLLSLYFFFRTRNISYLAAALFQVMIAIYLAILPNGIFPFPEARVAWFFYLCGLTFGVWLLYLAITKKARWKGREVYELAAANVEPSTHGYTERPRPVGKVQCTHSELDGFADYLKRNLVALDYWDNSTAFFVPVRMGEEYRLLLGMAGHYFQKSWISFDKEGNVTVKISKKDYYHYVDELEFDQLCQVMGDLFIEFFEDYKKGDELRILNRLDSVGMNFFS